MKVCLVLAGVIGVTASAPDTRLARHNFLRCGQWQNKGRGIRRGRNSDLERVCRRTMDGDPSGKQKHADSWRQPRLCSRGRPGGRDDVGNRARPAAGYQIRRCARSNAPCERQHAHCGKYLAGPTKRRSAFILVVLATKSTRLRPSRQYAAAPSFRRSTLTISSVIRNDKGPRYQSGPIGFQKVLRIPKVTTRPRTLPTP